jgi:hypothetical protein
MRKLHCRDWQQSIFSCHTLMDTKLLLDTQVCVRVPHVYTHKRPVYNAKDITSLPFDHDFVQPYREVNKSVSCKIFEQILLNTSKNVHVHFFSRCSGAGWTCGLLKTFTCHMMNSTTTESRKPICMYKLFFFLFKYDTKRMSS